jgi:UDP-GlcNAc:undecaprenyl-phosphate GlcNAc-1-phosphate transferase
MILIEKIIFIFVINLILHFFHIKTSKILKVYDKPDKFLKKHHAPVSVLGGFYIYINFFFIFFLFNSNFYYDNKVYLFFFFLSATLVFLIGFLDDKYNLNYILRFIILSFSIAALIFIDSNLQIKNIHVDTFNLNINLNFIQSFIFTLFSVMIFIFAFNMLDGIDLQIGFYTFFIFLIFIFKNLNFVIFLSFLVPLFFFLYLNFKKKVFLGDGGAYLLAFIISYFSIKNYNLNLLKVEEIILFMMLPGVDIIRIFFIRLSMNKNPFFGDLNHIHHIVINKYSLLTTVALIQLLNILPSIIFYLFGSFYLSLCVFLLIYIYLLKKN